MNFSGTGSFEDAEHKARALNQAGFTTLDKVKSRQVDWLWKPFIPFGAITLLEGDPSCGKSWITQYLAAQVSKGSPLPNGDIAPKGVALLLSAEDGLSETVKPRIELLGANTENIIVPTKSFVLDEDGFKTLTKLVLEYKPVLISFDPLFSFMGGKIDLHRSNQIRPFLHKLGDLASRHRLAVVAVRHLTKGARDKNAYRGSGAIDFTAVARSVLLAGTDPTDKDRRGLAQIKSNLGPMGETQGYKLSAEGLSWIGTIDLTATEMLAPEQIRSSTSLDSAKQFLRHALAQGGRKQTDLVKQATAQNLSLRTLERAKKEIGALSFKHSPVGAASEGYWVWQLSEPVEESIQGRQPSDFLSQPASNTEVADITKVTSGPTQGRLSYRAQVAALIESELSK